MEPKLEDDGQPFKTRKTRHLEPNTLAAGIRSEVKSFISVYDSEPKCAAYLRYDRMEGYRRISLSYLVIPELIMFLKLCSQGSQAVALELLRDLPSPDTEFAADFDEALAKHPLIAVEKSSHKSKDKKAANQTKKHQKLERAKNANYMLATLLYRFSEHMSKLQPMDSEQIDAAQANAIASLCDYVRAKDKTLPLPYNADVSTKLQLPKLDPRTDMGEAILERYNRIYNLFRAFQVGLAPSKWKQSGRLQQILILLMSR